MKKKVFATVLAGMMALRLDCLRKRRFYCARGKRQRYADGRGLLHSRHLPADAACCLGSATQGPDKLKELSPRTAERLI